MARRFDDLMLGSLELFCLAAELESFTLAAQSALHDLGDLLERNRLFEPR